MKSRPSAATLATPVAPAEAAHGRRGAGTAAAFLRFVACGGGMGIASSGALILLGGHLPLAIANAIITVVSTLMATELHSRFTFRTGRSTWRLHLQSASTALVCYLFTTAAMLGLHALESAPGVMVEQSVYLTASALAGVGRFLVLRLMVMARPAALTFKTGVRVERAALTIAA